VGFASQITAFHHFHHVFLVVQQLDFGAGGYIQARFDGAAVAQRNTDTGVGADQALFTHGNNDIAATGQGAHGRAAAAQVRTVAHDYAGRNTAFNHGNAQRAGVKVHKTFVHDGGAFTDVSAQTHAGGIGNTHAFRYHVVGHAREFIHAVHAQNFAVQAGFQLCRRQIVQIHGAFVGPGYVWQQTEHAGQVQAVGLGQTVRQQVQF